MNTPCTRFQDDFILTLHMYTTFHKYARHLHNKGTSMPMVHKHNFAPFANLSVMTLPTNRCSSVRCVRPCDLLQSQYEPLSVNRSG